MKIDNFKSFLESNNNNWMIIMETYDVYQLYELLVFKYGDIFKETKVSIDEYEGDYNPDHIYEIIKYELESLNIYEDFINNYSDYEIEKDEADPYHWRNRMKSQNNLMDGLD